MKVFEIIPADFFSVLVSPNREVYADALMKLYPNTEIILTLGAKGAMCGSTEGVFTSAAVKSTVVDTTAAVDTFTGYYLTLRAEGASIQAALDTANLAASVTVSRKGASDSIPWRSELSV